MIARLAEHLWILGYLTDIKCDFIAIYHMRWDECSSPDFFMLASRLPKYDGALRRTIEYEAHEEQSSGAGSYEENDTGFTPGQSMSMGAALSATNRGGALEAFNRESQQAGWGDLFEIATA